MFIANEKGAKTSILAFLLAFSCFQPVVSSSSCLCFWNTISNLLLKLGIDFSLLFDLDLRLCEGNEKKELKYNIESELREEDKIVQSNLKNSFENDQSAKFNIPITHDVDDRQYSLIEKPSIEFDRELNLDDKLEASNADLVKSIRYYLNQLLTSFRCSSLTAVTCFICIFCLATSCISKQKFKDNQSQTVSESCSLVNEIDFAMGVARIFAHLKKMSGEINSMEPNEKRREGILTDEILHLIAVHITKDDSLKNNLDLLYPETLLKLGELTRTSLLSMRSLMKP